MPKRSYVSPVRTDAVAEKRERIIDAAAQFFREEHSIQAFSLDAVAKAAGVTRLTVYNQFGSRNGLLEAVFDEIAQKGGIFRHNDARAMADPHQALHSAIEIFCDFWSSDPAIGRLHDAMAMDPDIAHGLTERMERGRQTIAAIVARIAGDGAAPAAQRDAADLIFALTGFASYRVLAQARSGEDVCGLLKMACDDVVRRMLA
ncbi:TetR/AcrR family transcriptional regulator [Undibacterium sp. TJN25]|uniref:TetR/AcrR family transcriptional regulator n=1 Tax=Undibacterium sp. TJN25 TaxID=3413056 RepID=UPI003BF306E8